MFCRSKPFVASARIVVEIQRRTCKGGVVTASLPNSTGAVQTGAIQGVRESTVM
jgi:hypothetical protein